MKIAAVIGSPHGTKGNTGKLLGALLDAAGNAGAELTTFSLAELDVRPCRACDVCHNVGTCAIKDDFAQIRKCMLDADGIVLASPNYIFSVSAQMKALMDRCCGPLHLQAFQGKYAAAVVTSGGSGADEVVDYLLRFLQALGCWTVGGVGTEGWKLSQESTRRPALEAAAALGSGLVAAANSKRTFPEQQAARQVFFERMRSLITSRRGEWPFEYEYWKSRGRL